MIQNSNAEQLKLGKGKIQIFDSTGEKNEIVVCMCCRNIYRFELLSYSFHFVSEKEIVG